MILIDGGVPLREMKQRTLHGAVPLKIFKRFPAPGSFQSETCPLDIDSRKKHRNIDGITAPIYLESRSLARQIHAFIRFDNVISDNVHVLDTPSKISSLGTTT